MDELAHQQRPNEGLRELALFAGAGGGILGGKLLGWRTVCAVEIEPYAASVLMQRQNDGVLDPFPIWDDIRTFDGRPWRGCIDVVSGGFPCQAYSTASRGKIAAEDLWPEMRRVVADVAPKYVFAENTERRAINKAADDLESMGYETRAVTLAASDLGADHIRERHWLFAHADSNGKLRRQINAETRMLPDFCCGVWQTDPVKPRVVDGVAPKLDRLRATGNGQIPIVAALAWRTLA